LTTAASVITILTFVYAVIAGLILYLYRGTQLLRNTDKEIVEFAKSLDSSFRDIRDIADTLQTSLPRHPPNEGGGAEMQEKAVNIFGEAKEQLESLAHTIDKFMPHSYDYSWWRQWRGRAAFNLKKDELKESQKKMNSMMVELRHLQETV
jgi:hypothetical protein